MQNVKTILTKLGKNEKVYIGPTNPIPGPTLPNVVATLEIEVIKSIPYDVTSTVAITKIDIYPTKNPIIP